MFMKHFEFDCLSIYRAMALSISLMFARLGGVIGSNTTSYLLENSCETTFYLSGSILLGECRYLYERLLFLQSSKFHRIYILINLSFCSNERFGILHSKHTQESDKC